MIGNHTNISTKDQMTQKITVISHCTAFSNEPSQCRIVKQLNEKINGLITKTNKKKHVTQHK